MGYNARISGIGRKWPPLLRQREIRFADIEKSCIFAVLIRARVAKW